MSATLTVAVPATRIFAVPADPTIPSAIDRTGWVQESVDRVPPTEVEVLAPPRALGWLMGQH